MEPSSTVLLSERPARLFVSLVSIDTHTQHTTPIEGRDTAVDTSGRLVLRQQLGPIHDQYVRVYFLRFHLEP